MTGSELRDARTRRGWTLRQMAGMLGVTRNHLSKYECGRQRIPWYRLEQIKEVLDESESV